MTSLTNISQVHGDESINGVQCAGTAEGECKSLLGNCARDATGSTRTHGTSKT